MDRTELDENQTDKPKLVEVQSESRAGNHELDPKIGATIGKYELLERIGSGAVSVVFKARDIALNRPVAIKFLLPDALDTTEFLARFKQEAKALGTLEHPNIVKVHEINVTTDGVPYMVMSYLNGTTLTECLAKEGRLATGRWLAMMIQACAALEHAHANGIIHRDIKPSNIVLAEEKEGEVLKLIDFGIAKNTLDEIALTKTGEVFGTPLYMSPEQCAGAKLDERSDIYSLGCVMYEALAGKAPLVGENSLSTMQKHLKEAPESLLSALSTSGPATSETNSLNSIVMKCLEKKPDDRYQTICDVKEDLSSLLQGDKPLLRLDYSGRQKTILISALLGLCVVITSIALLQMNREPANKDTTATVHKLPASDPLSTAATTKSDTEDKEESVAKDDPEITQQRRLLNSLMKESKRAITQKEFRTSIELDKKCLPLAVQLQDKILQGQILWRIGESHLNLKEYPPANVHFLQALQLVSGKKDNESKKWEYQALFGLGRIAAIYHDYERALAYYGRAYNSLQTRLPDVSKPDEERAKQEEHKGTCQNSIGDVYAMKRDMHSAHIYWRAALKWRPGNKELLKKLHDFPE